MTIEALPSAKNPLGPVRAVLYGALVVGVLDAFDAMIFFGFRGVPPIRIFQSIAGGLLGRGAFSGGLQTALLGALLHFFIAFTIVAVYYFAAGRILALTRHAIVCGLLYGVFVYFFMNYIVLPLSLAGRPPSVLPVHLNGIIGHALLIGLPAALFARLGRGESDSRRT